MAKSLQQKLNTWHPSPPIFAWIVIFIAILSAFGPFLIGLYASFKIEPGQIADQLKSQLWESVLFTVTQAGLSTALVVILAPVLGLSLIYTAPRYRRYSSVSRTLVFCLPSVVIATGIVLCWGKHGLGTRALTSMGFSGSTQSFLYSKYAIVIANVSMNLPFASILILNSIKSIDITQVRSARLLGLGYYAIFRTTIWPAIYPQMFYFAGLTFLLTMSSFGALSIFSGPNTGSTLEMNVYQSLYLNADWSAAAFFAICHTLCAGLVSVVFLAPQYLGMQNFLTSSRPLGLDEVSLKNLVPRGKILTVSCYCVSLAFDCLIAAPLIATQLDALADFNRILDPQSELANSLKRSLYQSLYYAFPSAILSTAMACSMARAFAIYKKLEKPVESMLIIVGIFSLNIVPAMANAFGFMALRSWLPGITWNFWPIVLLHSMLVLPFLTMLALQIYNGEMKNFLIQRHILGVPTYISLTKVEWPMMKRQAATMLVIALAMSLNETAIVSMLGSPESPTLTMSMIQLMGHYRFGDSAIASSILIIVTAIALKMNKYSRSPSHGSH